MRLAAPYGELSESLRQRVELVMKLFVALGEGFGLYGLVISIMILSKLV